MEEPDPELPEDLLPLEEDDGKLPLKLCELCNFFEPGPLETPGFNPDFELLLELEEEDELLLLPPLLPLEFFLFWMVSLIPSELGLTIYSELLACTEAAAAEDK